MVRSVRLRRWQAQALERFSGSGQDFLAVATPGAGKTTFALVAALTDLAGHPSRRLVVVAPTAHLKTQWVSAASRFGLHLDPDWTASTGALPADMHGIVTTYQQVSLAAPALAELCRGAFAVFDEIHHAGDERAWGDGLRAAFDGASRRLALSGTPFRSDTNAIPFVRYVGDEAEPDYEYGYGEALADGKVVRPIFFPRTDGRMEWTGADGLVRSATFADQLDAASSGQRLRTALSLHGEWLPAVLDAAHARLLEVRRSQHDAGGLIIATDQEHARGIAGMVRERLGVSATVATSEDPDASARISRFGDGADPWLVAVRMVSEGVDIPRLRVGVYATTTTTELFFRQAVGRFVRWRPELARQQSYLFLPDDRRLRAWATQITEQRRHILRRRDADADGVDEERDPAPADDVERDQLSLFSVISATPLGAPVNAVAAFDDVPAEQDPGDDGTFAVSVAPPPPLPGRDTAQASPAGLTRQAHKRRLRDHNAAKVRTLARLTGLSHQKINLELNRRVGLRAVGQATVAQLERRVQAADEWLRRL
jgi:superfamily II DNA or RNA helicase